MFVVSKIDKLEADARASSDSSSVEKYKKAKADFITRGIISNDAERATYEDRINKEKERLKIADKALVEALQINKLDDIASVMTEKLELVLEQSPTPNPADALPNEDNRKEWKNNSYNTTFYYKGADDWDEINASGKLERKMKELSRNDEYIELLLTDRQQQIRVYNKRADLFREGRWQWVSSGNWVFKD